MVATDPKSAQVLVTAAYDRAAPAYDHWDWQTFWTKNEVPIVRALLDVRPRPNSAVDLGTGRYLALLTALGINAIGVDPSEPMLRIARERVGPGVQLVQGDLLSLTLESRADCALACRVLSHIGDVKAALRRIGELVADGGRLILSDLHPQHRYECTRIEFEGSEIEIPTFKHHPGIIAKHLIQFGWRIESQRELTYEKLDWRPPARVFRSVDRSGRRPIFYVIAATEIDFAR